MTNKQVSALLKAHGHLLARLAEVEADTVVIREALFTLLDELIQRDGKPLSQEFEEKLNKLQKDRLSAATREAGRLQDEILNGK